MAKVFTIAEGLENLGALRTGGQGSVYKAKRTGEIIVAVKLLPTPIVAENNDDKNYRDFRNEVEKLQKVNEHPNPHVVKILNSGITESGSLPFIEMEYIEGPDLGELLTPPHDPVFSIAELIKVTDQLGNALNHCHKNGIRHGDIKSNNVKCNSRTGNYMLLDFGLAVMSDEQRRSSLQHAGAVEFMAPEQSEGKLLYQSDIYSYGIILFELLAGTVPYPLKDNGHSARNTVLISHLETPLPDPLKLREQHIPSTWSAEKKQIEMQVPQWLLGLIFKCLEKDPLDRYDDGTQLYNTIVRQKNGLTVKNDIEGALILQNKNEQLQAALAIQQEKVNKLEQEIASLQYRLRQSEQIVPNLEEAKITSVPYNNPVKPKQTFPLWLTVLIILAFIGAFTAYLINHSDGSDKNVKQSSADSLLNNKRSSAATKRKSRSHYNYRSLANGSTRDDSEITPPDLNNSNGKVYELAVKYAYFHNSPNDLSKRRANINIWNNARLTALDEQNGYIYVIYKNEQGQVSKGWLDKRDLKLIQ